MTTQDSQLRWTVCLSHELHPRVKDAIGNNFVSEHFDLAILAAMRGVEIRLRELAAADASQLGVALVRSALHPEEGPLTDLTAERGEREALGHLFAGALGVFKNPGSHRRVAVETPTEAAEIIALADLLIRLIERRASAIDAPVRE